MSNTAGKRGIALAARRREECEKIFGDVADKVWNRKESKGFTTVPRVLPLMLTLIQFTSRKKGNPGRVYLDFWCRAYDEGYVEITDEGDLAYSAGYTGTRAVRSWQENTKQLEEMGFIRIAPRGVRKIGYVLILDPFRVATELKEKGEVPNEWWNAFTSRASKIGAAITKRTKPKKRKG